MSVRKNILFVLVLYLLIGLIALVGCTPAQPATPYQQPAGDETDENYSVVVLLNGGCVANIMVAHNTLEYTSSSTVVAYSVRPEEPGPNYFPGAYSMPQSNDNLAKTYMAAANIREAKQILLEMAPDYGIIPPGMTFCSN